MGSVGDMLMSSMCCRCDRDQDHEYLNPIFEVFRVLPQGENAMMQFD